VIPDTQQVATGQGMNINLGDANAISGDLHVNDSHAVHNEDKSIHNITNTTSTVNNITQVAAQKTEIEILQEKKTLYLNECKRAYEDNVLEQSEVVALEECRIKLGLDKSTANTILESVRVMSERNARKTELNPIARTKLKILTDNLQKNEVKALMQQIDTLEPLVNRYEHDELRRKFYLVLAALKSEKCIALYENTKTDNYWNTFWSYLAYIKSGRISEAEDTLASLDRFTSYPEDNMTVLAAAGELMKGHPEEAKEYLDATTGEYTPALQRFVDSLYLLLAPQKAKKAGADENTCAFYLVNFFGQKDSKVKAEEERIRKAKAEEEAKRKAKEEEAKRKAKEAEEARKRAEEERRRLEAERKAKEEAIRKAKEAEEAKRRAEEAKRRAEAEAKRRAEEERIRKEKEAEEARRRAEEEAILKAKKAEEDRIRKAKEAEEAKRRAEEEAIRKEKEAEEAKRRAEEERRREISLRESRRIAAEEERRDKQTSQFLSLIGFGIGLPLILIITMFIIGLFSEDYSFSFLTYLGIFAFSSIIGCFAIREDHDLVRPQLYGIIGIMAVILVILLWRACSDVTSGISDDELKEKYDSVYVVGDDGLRIVSLNGKKGLIDKRGNEKLPLQYDEISELLEDEVRIVKLNGKKGLLRKNGEELIAPKCDEIRNPVVKDISFVHNEKTIVMQQTTRIFIVDGKMGLVRTKRSEYETYSVDPGICFEAEYDTIYYSDEYKNWLGQQ
jgi:uncharacterized membrane protein